MAWHEAEWYSPSDRALTGYTEAWSASDEQGLVECEVTHHETNGWFWVVKATSRLSEWPEVQNAGPALSLQDACDQAHDAMLKATKGRAPRAY